MAQPGGHRDPLYLKETILSQKITDIHFVPSMFRAFLDRLGDDRLTTYPTRVYLIGEAVTADLVDQAHRSMDAEIHNLYGPTEAAVDVTHQVCGPECRTGFVPIGHPIANTQIYVVSPRMKPQPIGVPGELLIGGVSLARGYPNRPDLTADKWIPHPFAEEPGLRVYRTGDLVRYQPDGNIIYLGRIDHQVKLRGFRIELGEIESCLEDREDVSRAVVLVRQMRSGPERLIAYVQTQTEDPIPGLRRHMQGVLPEYMVPSLFVILDSFPLTPNGKINRGGLPDPDPDQLTGGTDFAAPESEVEQILAGIWADLLNLEQVGIQDNFFEIGGHSLLATMVVSRVEESLGKLFSLKDFFNGPTIAAMATILESGNSLSATRQLRIEPTPEDTPLEPSLAQIRLWHVDKQPNASSTFNIGYDFRVDGEFNVPILERVLVEMVRRHQSLRTCFPMIDGQIIAKEYNGPVVLDIVDLTGVPEKQQTTLLRSILVDHQALPFNIEDGPLYRFKLFLLGPNLQALSVKIHHITTDGWSINIFFREVGALYTALMEQPGRDERNILPPVPLQYRDFVAWQNRFMESEQAREELDWWVEELEGAPQTIELPWDRPRPAIQEFEGDMEPFELSVETVERLYTLCRSLDMTPFMVLQTAYAILLAGYNSFEDILIGVPVANRNSPEIEKLSGFVVNLLVMRNRLGGNPSYRGALKRGRETALEAFNRQDVPYAKVAELVTKERSPSCFPLFQVLFILQVIEVRKNRLFGHTQNTGQHGFFQRGIAFEGLAQKRAHHADHFLVIVMSISFVNGGIILIE